MNRYRVIIMTLEMMTNCDKQGYQNLRAIHTCDLKRFGSENAQGNARLYLSCPDRQTGRQTERQTKRQIGRQTDRQTDRQRNR